MQRLEKPRHLRWGEPSALASAPCHLAKNENAIDHPAQLLNLEAEASLDHPSAPPSFRTSSVAASQPGLVTLTSRLYFVPRGLNSFFIALMRAAKLEESSFL